jgi:hypothetical protein
LHSVGWSTATRLRRPAELRVHRTLCPGVTTLGGARYLGRPSHRSPCAAPRLLRGPRTALAIAGGRWAGRLGRSGPAQTRIHGPKARKAPAWNGNRASGAFCGTLGDVRLGPEEVPADNPLTSVTPTVDEKRYDSATAAAAPDTGIRPATPQRMRHPPRRPPRASYHHCDCDPPSRVRPAGLDFQLTMAAATRRLILLCDGGGLA